MSGKEYEFWNHLAELSFPLLLSRYPETFWFFGLVMKI